MAIRTRRIRNPHQHIGRRGQCRMYKMEGGSAKSFFSSLVNKAANFGKMAGKHIFSHAKAIAPHVGKALAQAALTHGATKLGEYASKKGVPANVINTGSQLAQLGAKKIGEIEAPKLDPRQKMVSDFVSNRSQNLLSNILQQAGVDGAPTLGTGHRRRDGGSLIKEQQPSITGGPATPYAGAGARMRRR